MWGGPRLCGALRSEGPAYKPDDFTRRCVDHFAIHAGKQEGVGGGASGVSQSWCRAGASEWTPGRPEWWEAQGWRE